MPARESARGLRSLNEKGQNGAPRAPDVVKYLVETNPSSLQMKDECNQTLLHIACTNGYITTRTVKLLLEAWPDSVHERDGGTSLPIHCLCGNYEENETQMMDDKVAKDISSYSRHIQSLYQKLLMTVNSLCMSLQQTNHQHSVSCSLMPTRSR